MIIEGHYVQPCVYDSGIWVTLLCPHSHLNDKEIILKDAKYIQYENREGIFKWTEDLDETE